ncbi:MAG: universal stress protein [Deltaproteobacteria bacterium]|nr:universal stress protein [Deltaproteobacteria bacterium]
MLPFKKILCPTDFSKPSGKAMKAAGELALHFSSELLVVHVVVPVPVVPGIPLSVNVAEYQQELEISSKKKLENWVRNNVSKKIRAGTRVVLGDPAEQIVKIAGEEETDLIVIATQGQTGFKRLAFGSVTEKVVRLSPEPVLTIRPASTPKQRPPAPKKKKR